MRRPRVEDLESRITALERARPWVLDSPPLQLPAHMAPMIVALVQPGSLDPPASEREQSFAALAIHIALRQSEGHDTSAAELHLERTRATTRWS